MTKKKGWEKRFAEKMNKEISAYKRENSLYGKDSHWILVGIKDTLYLLGESINEGYKFANGWRKFCEDMGINIQDNNELGLDSLSKPSMVSELIASILKWWEEHQFDECGEPENPKNVYDEEPNFVKIAKSLKNGEV